MREDWSPSKKGFPIKAEQMDEAGEVDRGSGQDGFHSAAEVPPLNRKVEGLGTRMELWNTEDRGSPWASLAGCLATVGNHLSGSQGSQGGPLLSAA